MVKIIKCIKCREMLNAGHYYTNERNYVFLKCPKCEMITKIHEIVFNNIVLESD